MVDSISGVQEYKSMEFNPFVHKESTSLKYTSRDCVNS